MTFEITTIEPNVDLISFSDGREITLIGTAHVSRTSADLVEEIIERTKPDTVCVELCKPRYETLSQPQRWQETDIVEVLKSGRTYVLMAQLALAGFQKKIGKELGIKPGEEMLRALESSQAIGAELELVDREVKITLKRAWAKASLWSLLKIGFSIFSSLFQSEKMSEAEIEALKESDALLAVVNEFAHFLPGIKTALIDERDLYMAEKIVHAPGKRIVAVVGAGHTPGIKKHMGQSIDIPSLEAMPPKRKSLQLIAWGVPLLILSLFAYGFLVSGKETSIDMFSAWVLANGSLSALGALLALAHPLTILTAFVAAPITSLNPTMAAGWICGIVEAVIRKPRVGDLENLGEDITSVRSLWSNRVTKVLLIVAFANLGSSLGTFIGGTWMASLLRS